MAVTTIETNNKLIRFTASRFTTGALNLSLSWVRSATLSIREPGRLGRGPAKMAATNKCLAQSNKTRTDGNATKKRESLPVGQRKSCAGQVSQRQDPLRVSAAGYFMTEQSCGSSSRPPMPPARCTSAAA
jgi:hypothetical protein